MPTVYPFPNPNTTRAIALEVADLVNGGFATAQSYANSTFVSARDYLDDLAAIANNVTELPDVSTSLGAVEQVVGPFVEPADPTAPAGLEFAAPPTPTEPALTAVPAMTTHTPPEFTATIAPIDLDIALPAALTSSVPAAPDLLDVTTPDAPDANLPDVPTLLGITVPTVPLLSLPTFTAVTPDSPLAPDFIFSFAESEYTSTLLTALRTNLLAWVDGTATGLTAQVENAIWERGRVRELAAAAKKMEESRRQFASWGFTKPPGALALDIAEAEQATQNTLVAQSREVMIAQANLEQSNRRFAFEQALKVEGELISYTSQIAQRAFEAAKFVQQFYIDLYRENVSRYQADIQKFSAGVESYKARLAGELSKLELYKAELEGQKLIGELNMQSVEIYKARVQAAQAVIEIFKTQVEAANTLAQVNKTRIEGFAAQVNAYGETVRAKASEYDAYATRIKAEVSKADIFKAQADAYGSQMEGFGAMIAAEVAQKNLEVKINQEVPLDLFKARTEVFRSQVSAESDRVRALNETFSTDARVYDSKVQAQTGRMSAESTVFRAQADLAIGEANIRIEAARANLQALIEKVRLLVESAKAGAQVSAQLAASALSGVNLSAGLSSSGTAGESYGLSSQVSGSESLTNQNSVSTATQYNYQFTP